MDVHTAFEIVISCTSARDAIEKLNLPRCRLHALLASRAFAREMEDYRIIAKCIITDRAAQYGGMMMGNLANLTNGRNEDSARKACMAGLSQAMDGHIRPGPGRPAKTPTLPAHAADGRASGQTTSAGTPSIVPLPDLRQNILNFIQNAPATPQDALTGPFSIDKSLQISTEIDSPFIANDMQHKDLKLSDCREKSETLLQCETSPVAS